MEFITLIILFIAPGLAIKVYDREKYSKIRREKKKGTIYEELFWIVVWSIWSSAVTLIIVNAIRFKEKSEVIFNMNSLINEFNEFVFIAEWIGIAVAVTLISKIIHIKFVRPLLFKFRNKKYEDESGVVECYEDGKNVWESIFMDKEYNQNILASVYKDGNYVTTGYITAWNLGSDEEREFTIERTTELARIRASDRYKEYKDRTMKYVEYEYYNTETDLLIQVWDDKEVKERWDELLD